LLGSSGLYVGIASACFVLNKSILLAGRAGGEEELGQ